MSQSTVEKLVLTIGGLLMLVGMTGVGLSFVGILGTRDPDNAFTMAPWMFTSQVTICVGVMTFLIGKFVFWLLHD